VLGDSWVPRLAPTSPSPRARICPAGKMRSPLSRSFWDELRVDEKKL
jgi:hypothetical protein